MGNIFSKFGSIFPSFMVVNFNFTITAQQNQVFPSLLRNTYSTPLLPIYSNNNKKPQNNNNNKITTHSTPSKYFPPQLRECLNNE